MFKYYNKTIIIIKIIKSLTSIQFSLAIFKNTCNFVFVNKQVNILNKKAKFEYQLIDQYKAGIVLTGTEIKSIRLNKASISESFCEFNDNQELFIINMFIDEYEFGNHYNHKTKSQRKLLLNKKELKKLNKDVKNTGLTIIPLKVFINEKGFAKVLISLAKGKKTYDKRQVIKERENKINLDRLKKISFTSFKKGTNLKFP